MCAGRATRRAPGAFASDRRRTRALAARKARALEPKEQARPGDPLRTVALGWSRPFPRRRAGRDRLQYSRAIDQASRPHAQKRPLRGLGWRRGKLGRHRLADRNLQAERRRPLRLSRPHTHTDRRRSPRQGNRRTSPMGIRQRPATPRPGLRTTLTWKSPRTQPEKRAETEEHFFI